MNADDVIAALELPEGTRVDQRVPKKLLIENGAPTAADRRRIGEGIDELVWLAALKPTTIGIPVYRDNLREYLEIAVLRLVLRPGAKAARLTELVHRAVPYPMLLVVLAPSSLAMSLAHKRWSQGERGSVVLDRDVVTTSLYRASDSAILTAFLGALPVAKQPSASLYALYQGWIDTALALEAARLTGAFAPATSGEHAAARHDALRECERLQARIASLRAAGEKEKQLSRQVELNLELQRARAGYAAARARL